MAVVYLRVLSMSRLNSGTVVIVAEVVVAVEVVCFWVSVLHVQRCVTAGFVVLGCPSKPQPNVGVQFIVAVFVPVNDIRIQL